VPPSEARLDTLYCAFGFAFAVPCACACACARAAPQQKAIRIVKRLRLGILVLRSVVIFCPLLNFYDDTLGTGGKSQPEPLRAFGTTNFALHSTRSVIPHTQTTRY